MSERQTGRSTKQITEAPSRAIYVCPGWGSVWYHGALAKKLGREDLYFTGKFDTEIALGRRVPVVVDHAADLSDRDTDFINLWNREI